MLRSLLETLVLATVYTLLIGLAGWGISSLWTVTAMKLGCGSELPVWGSALLFAYTSHSQLWPTVATLVGPKK